MVSEGSTEMWMMLRLRLVTLSWKVLSQDRVHCSWSLRPEQVSNRDINRRTEQKIDCRVTKTTTKSSFAPGQMSEQKKKRLN